MSYYRITKHQLDIISANPYLTVESIADPNPGSRTDSIIARHEYPSARTYQRFKEKLSPELLSDLESATQLGKIKDATTPEFQSLTKRILNELWKDVVNDQNPIRAYRIAMGIHPFKEQNGETMRFLFSVGYGRPVILRNWDWTLFLDDVAFNHELQSGQHFLAMFQFELQNLEKQNPTFPKAFDARAPYAYFFDNGNLEHVANDTYLEQARAFFRNPKVSERISQKLILQTGDLQTDPCGLIMGGNLKD